MANLVQVCQYMRKIHDRVSTLVHRVEDVVAEQFDDITVARLRPSRVSVKPEES